PTTAPPGHARSTTRAITAPSCSTPTATTSRPSATSPKTERGHCGRGTARARDGEGPGREGEGRRGRGTARVRAPAAGARPTRASRGGPGRLRPPRDARDVALPAGSGEVRDASGGNSTETWPSQTRDQGFGPLQGLKITQSTFTLLWQGQSRQRVSDSEETWSSARPGDERAIPVTLPARSPHPRPSRPRPQPARAVAETAASLGRPFPPLPVPCPSFPLPSPSLAPPASPDALIPLYTGLSAALAQLALQAHFSAGPGGTIEHMFVETHDI